MSGLNLDITYNDVVDTVVNWIKSNCKNIDNMNSLPDCYKAGFNKTFSCIRTGDNGWTPSFNITTNSYVSAVGSATVKSQFQTFLTSTCKLPSLSSVIYDNKFLALMEDIMSYCSTKCLHVACSPYDTNYYNIAENKYAGGSTITPNLKTSERGYMVYDQSGSTNYDNVQSLAGDNSNEKKILASDFTPFFKSLLTTINQRIKVKAINYTVTFN